MAKVKPLSRIQSLPKDARNSEAQSGPIYRSCSDTKAEQDKWRLLHTHDSPKSAGWCIQDPTPASIHMPAERHESVSVPEYSSGKQAGRAEHDTKPQARLVPDKATRHEGRAGEGCHYVPSKAHTQNFLSKDSSGKHAGKAINMANPHPGSIPEQATKSEGEAEETCKYVPASKNKSGKQEGRAVQKATHQPRSEAKATGCESDRAARSEAKAELAREATSDSAEAAQWQMLGAQLAPATYSFYSTEAPAAVEDSIMYAISGWCKGGGPRGQSVLEGVGGCCLCGVGPTCGGRGGNVPLHANLPCPASASAPKKHRFGSTPACTGRPNAAIPCMYAVIPCTLQHHACTLPGAMFCHGNPYILLHNDTQQAISHLQ